MQKYRRLSESNRKDIQTMFESGATKREIARSIDKSPSTVCRELARNRNRGGQYRSSRAHRVAKRRLVNKGARPRLIRASLEKNVKTRLRKLHSPEQVANTLVVGSQGSPSTSTIYRFVRRDKDNGGRFISAYGSAEGGLMFDAFMVEVPFQTGFLSIIVPK